MDVLPARHRRRPRLSLASYVRRRTGRPLGAPGSLGHMLRRAFGASTVAAFWRHWNPIFGYGLSRFVYTPLRRLMPHGGALLVTFLACGALHDAVTAAVRRSAAFFFTPWFALLAGSVWLGDVAGINLARLSFVGRAIVHVLILGGTLVLTLLLRVAIGAP